MPRLPRALTLTAIGAIYLMTLSPYVQGGDSGELIVDAIKLATPHPPGYPLYLFFAHLFTLIPVSTEAWRVGLFSLTSQLACGWILFSLCKEWLGRPWIACAVTLGFCLAPLTWRYAIEPEVFALNNLFATLLLWCLHRYDLTCRQTQRYAYVTCAILGLACCHHLTIALFALPLFATFMWRDRVRLVKPRVLGIGTAIFVICLLPYLSLFYYGRQRLLIAWGDFSTWDGFWTHVLRREYGTFRLASDDKENSTLLPKLYYFAREMTFETFGVLLLASLWGGIAAFRRRERFAIALVVALLFYVFVFHSLSNLDLSIAIYNHAQSRMWILPLLLITLIAGYGLKELSTGPIMTWALGTLVMAGVGASVVSNWKVLDESKRDFFERVGHTMIDGVEPYAVVLMREDVYVNSVRYLQVVQNVRPDVSMIPMDSLWWPWMKGLVETQVPGFRVPGAVLRVRANPQFGEYALRDLLDANIDRFPLYVAKLTAAEEQTLHGLFTGFPYGFHSRVKRLDPLAGPDSEAFTFNEFQRESAPFLSLKMPARDEFRWASWEYFVYQNYFAVKLPVANLLIQRSKNRLEWIQASLDILNSVIKESDEFRAPALAQLGQLYANLIPANPSFRKLAIDTWEQYLDSGHSSVNSEGGGKIREALAALKKDFK